MPRPPERKSTCLSDVLRTVRLTGALFFPLDASSPWADEIPAATEFAPTLLPGAQHVVSYHIVTQGRVLGDPPPTVRPSAWRLVTSSWCLTATRTSCRARQACAPR